ncbi:MAG: terminase TerL endonuclease subunit [Bryobacteraceae bacterium]
MTRRYLHFVFDEERATAVIDFIETTCFLTKGKGAGAPIKLRPWQKRIIGELFGWIDPATGYRRYRTLFLGLPRKNGKSHLIACIACVMLFFDNEPGAEVVLAANSKEQSSIVFNAANDMIRFSPILSPLAKRKASTYKIAVEQTSSVLKSIAAEADTALGLNPSCYIYDEYSFCSKPDFHSALSTSQGARMQPLACYITTAGWDFQGVGFKMWQYAREVQKDQSKDPTFLAILYELEPEQDYTDEVNWSRVNPALSDFLTIESLRQVFQQEDPHVFKQYHLNQWTQAPKTWLKVEQWDACADPNFDESTLKSLPCFLAFDLSAVQDITAVTAVWTLPDGRHYLKAYSWLPDYNGRLRDKVTKDHVAYDKWAEQGWLTLIPGMAIDQDYIQAHIEKLAEEFLVKCCGFDPHGATKIVTDLEKTGLVMVKVRPGALTLSQPTKELERAVLSKRIVHDGNPCMSWQVSNVSLAQDRLGNVMPDKDRSTGRIDNVTAAVMALECATRMQPQVKPKAPFRVTVLG